VEGLADIAESDQGDVAHGRHGLHGSFRHKKR
jgi:hypothetical protein